MKRLFLASLPQCNENCLFCVRKGDEKPLKFMATSQAKRIIEEKSKQGYKEICFDGGEPTLRKDLAELIEFSKSSGFKNANIMTNGVLLNKKLMEKIPPYPKGFNLSFSVSLHSHKKDVSEKIVGTKDTFDKTIRGLKEIFARGHQDVSIYHAITLYNYRDLPGFVEFVSRNFPGTRQIIFSFLYPAGAVFKNPHIFPRLSEVEPYFYEAVEKCKELKVNFTISSCGSVPLCFLRKYREVLIRQQQIDQPENIGIIDANQDIGYQLATKKFHNKTKIKSRDCLCCDYFEKCGGIWRFYAERYGINELKPVVNNAGQKPGENVLLVMTGFSCNNNCLFCSNVTERTNNRSFFQIRKNILGGRKRGYRTLEFIGGEPTIRPDFIELISVAKKAGFNDIRVTSNGRFFSYRQFAEKATEAGLRVVNISLYGHTKILHEGATRTPGSFKQCIQGIKNIANIPEIKLIINTVVSKINYRFLEAIGKFVHKLGAAEWHLLELLPDGLGEKNYAALSMSYTNIYPYINKLEKIADVIPRIDIFDFPFCVFREKILSDSRFAFFTPRHRYEDIKQIGYNSKRVRKIEKNGQVEYKDKYRIKPTVCKTCRHNNKCGGVTRKYISLYGEEEFSLLARKANG